MSKIDPPLIVLNIVVTLVVAVGCLVVYDLKFSNHIHVADEQTAKGMVVVDSRLLLESYIEKLEHRLQSGEGFTAAQLEHKGVDFGVEFMRTLKEYGDRGFIVVDKKYVVGVPRNVEITERIAASLGLQVEARPDPFFLSEVSSQ